MKTKVLSIALLITISTQAQKIHKSNVPSPVTKAFVQKYPSSKVEKWEKEGANYEAEFELNNVESSAVFDENGNFKEIEQEIALNELPKKALIYCSQQYVNHQLTEAAKIINSNGSITFEAELKKGEDHFDILFDENGTFIKKN